MAAQVILTNERNAPALEVQPKVRLGPWRVFRSACGDFHICAELAAGRLRFSSALAHMDFVAGLAVTSSGREYAFVTPPAHDPDVEEMIAAFAVSSGLHVATDVSEIWWNALIHGPDVFPEAELSGIRLRPPTAP